MFTAKKEEVEGWERGFVGDHKCMTDSCIGLRIQPGKSTSSNKSVPGFRQVVQPPDTTSSYNTFEIPNSKHKAKESHIGMIM